MGGLGCQGAAVHSGEMERSPKMADWLPAPSSSSVLLAGTLADSFLKDRNEADPRPGRNGILCVLALPQHSTCPSATTRKQQQQQKKTKGRRKKRRRGERRRGGRRRKRHQGEMKRKVGKKTSMIRKKEGVRKSNTHSFYKKVQRDPRASALLFFIQHSPQKPAIRSWLPVKVSDSTGLEKRGSCKASRHVRSNVSHTKMRPCKKRVRKRRNYGWIFCNTLQHDCSPLFHISSFFPFPPSCFFFYYYYYY